MIFYKTLFRHSIYKKHQTNTLKIQSLDCIKNCQDTNIGNPDPYNLASAITSTQIINKLVRNEVSGAFFGLNLRFFDAKFNVLQVFNRNYSLSPRNKYAPSLRSSKKAFNSDLNYDIGIVKFFDHTRCCIHPIGRSDIYIKILKESDLNRALNGDTVTFEVLKINTRGHKTVRYGRVISIITKSEPSLFFGQILKDVPGDYYVLIGYKNPYFKAYVSKNDSLLDFTAYFSLYAATIVEWPEYLDYPVVKLVKRFQADNLVDEEVLLHLSKNQLTHFFDDYNSEKYLNEVTDLDVPNDRKDLTGECVFTIDPESASDYDDAISFKRLTKDYFQVGVHIADVSHFVRPGSEYDERARKYCSTLYLVHRAFHMLPQSLASNLCSLVANKNRYTVSVVMTFDKKCNPKTIWIGRTVIKSCAKLTYEDAQKLMTPDICPEEISIPVYNGFSISDIQDSLNQLSKFTDHLRENRLKSCITVNSQSHGVKFELNPINKHPIAINSNSLLKSNNLIEELMILANLIVGKTIYDKCQLGSILRVHFLSKIKHKFFLQRMISANFPGFSGSMRNTTLSLARRMAKVDSEKGPIIWRYYGMFMNQAIYVVVDEENKVNGSENNSIYSHFGLGLEFYTHFTSPIRRYIDILVHRHLLDLNPVNQDLEESIEILKKSVSLCNNRKSQYDMMEQYFVRFNLWLYIKANGPLKSKACFFPNTGILLDDPYDRIYLISYNLIFKYKDNPDDDAKREYFSCFDVIIHPQGISKPFSHVAGFPFRFEII